VNDGRWVSKSLIQGRKIDQFASGDHGLLQLYTLIDSCNLQSCWLSGELGGGRIYLTQRT
jgi:hypothetical protein